MKSTNWIIVMVRKMPDGKEAVSYFRDIMFGIPCFGQRQGALEYPTKKAAKVMTKNWRGTFRFEQVA